MLYTLLLVSLTACSAMPSLKDKQSGCVYCNNCEGDCDQDSDCAGELKCFIRSEGVNKGKPVPGCENGGSGDISTYDYCYSDPQCGTSCKNDRDCKDKSAPICSTGFLFDIKNFDDDDGRCQSETIGEGITGTQPVSGWIGTESGISTWIKAEVKLDCATTPNAPYDHVSNKHLYLRVGSAANLQKGISNYPSGHNFVVKWSMSLQGLYRTMTSQTIMPTFIHLPHETQDIKFGYNELKSINYGVGNFGGQQIIDEASSSNTKFYNYEIRATNTGWSAWVQKSTSSSYTKLYSDSTWKLSEFTFFQDKSVVIGQYVDIDHSFYKQTLYCSTKGTYKDISVTVSTNAGNPKKPTSLGKYNEEITPDIGENYRTCESTNKKVYNSNNEKNQIACQTCMNSGGMVHEDDDENGPFEFVWFGDYIFAFIGCIVLFIVIKRRQGILRQRQLEQSRQRQQNGNGQTNVVVVGGAGPQGGIAMQPMQPTMQPMQPTVQPYAPSLPANQYNSVNGIQPMVVQPMVVQPMVVQPTGSYAQPVQAAPYGNNTYGGNATMAVVQPMAVPQGNQQPQYAQGPVVMPMAVPNANTY